MRKERKRNKYEYRLIKLIIYREGSYIQEANETQASGQLDTAVINNCKV